MKLIRNVKVNAIKIMTSYGFYICIIFTAILCLGAQIYTDDMKNEHYSVIRVLTELDREFLFQNVDLCSFNVIMEGSGSWLFMFIPIIAAYAFVPMLCDEYDARAVRFSIFRSSKFSFNTSKFLTACFFGGLAVVIGYGIFAVFIYYMFPNITEYSPQLQQIFKEEISYVYPYFSEWGYNKILIAKFCQVFLYGMIWAVPAMLCTSFMTNKYLVLCIPFFMKYAMNQICKKLSIQAWSDIQNPNEKLGRLSNIIYPDAIADLGKCQSDILYIVIYNVILVLIAYVIYLIIRNRRVDCSE